MLVALCDRYNNFLVIHRISSRASRTPVNTYEAELLAMVKAFKFFEDYKQILFELVGRQFLQPTTRIIKLAG